MIHAHSGLRWLVLILLLTAIVNGVIGLFGKKEFAKKDKMINMMTMGFFHLQVVIGIVVYFTSGKVDFSKMADEHFGIMYRFFTAEHPVFMLLAAAVITIGNRKVKKAEESNTKFRRTIWWFLATLLVVMYAIPWSDVYHANWF